MGSSITLLRIFGIPFRINYTWLVIFGLVISILAMNQFPSTHPRWSTAEYWLVAAVTTLFFFASVVFHELSHALVALRNHIPVKSITLFIFGGVAQIAREAERPRVEAIIALAGPFSSLLLAGVFYLIYRFVGPLNEQVGAVAGWLSLINVSLAVFNMLPGFPLDGGRVFRSIVWSITSDYLKATKLSAWVGRGIAYLLIAGGVFVSVWEGQWVSGIWLIFIGLFLDTAAMTNLRQTMLRESLRGREAGELMIPLPMATQPVAGVPTVESTENLSRVVEEMDEKDVREVLVVRGGLVVGVIRRETLRGLTQG